MAKTQKTQTTPQVNPLTKYFRETRGELRKVTWPTREDAQRLTLIVLGVAVAFSLFLGLLDFGFSELVGLIVDLVSGA